MGGKAQGLCNAVLGALMRFRRFCASLIGNVDMVAYRATRRKCHVDSARSGAAFWVVSERRGVAENGYVLLSEQTLPLCWQELSSGPDLVLKRDTRFSHGFMMGLPGPLSSFGPGARNFGHNGLGGTLAVADPDRKMGFAYVTNHLGNYVLVDPRARALLDATYASI
jgi:CubicO group peptidase (beta-lactamase class C family)